MSAKWAPAIGARVQTPQDGPGTVLEDVKVGPNAPRSTRIARATFSIAVKLDRPPAGLFGGDVRYYAPEELEELLC